MTRHDCPQCAAAEAYESGLWKFDLAMALTCFVAAAVAVYLAFQVPAVVDGDALQQLPEQRVEIVRSR